MSTTIFARRRPDKHQPSNTSDFPVVAAVQHSVPILYQTISPESLCFEEMNDNHEIAGESSTPTGPAPVGGPPRGRGRGRLRGRSRGRGRGRARGRGRPPSLIQEENSNSLSHDRMPSPTTIAPTITAEDLSAEDGRSAHPVLPKLDNNVHAVNHANRSSARPVRSRTTSTTLSEMTESRFQDLSVQTALQRAVRDIFKYDTMTVVQDRSIPISLAGRDVLTKARTGTGKTLAFLIPALHRTLTLPPPNCTSVLVLSPTRELAQQIADEAACLTTFINTFSMQIVFGGTDPKKDLAQFRNRVPHLLVATPGRLVDHLSNAESGFREALTTLSVLILDEADRLMDMGFNEEIDKIFGYLPPPSARQTLLFSATLPQNVQSIARRALRNNFDFIDCVGESDNTHMHVAQSVVVTPLEEQLAGLGVLLAQCMIPEYKILVFFTTARQTQFCAELFQCMGQSVLEMHSRKSQPQRMRVSDKFRTEKSVVMFTSDVTARGLDYPDVTTVIQVGLPTDREQYIHRIGRTGRAGKGGNGVLLVTPEEADAFLDCVSDLPLRRVEQLGDEMMAAMRTAMTAAVQKVEYNTKKWALQAWLGFHNSHLKKLNWDKTQLVEVAGLWAREVAGLDGMPPLPAMVIGKMRLQGVAGIVVEDGRGARGGARGGRARGGVRGRGRGALSVGGSGAGPGPGVSGGGGSAGAAAAGGSASIAGRGVIGGGAHATTGRGRGRGRAFRGSRARPYGGARGRGGGGFGVRAPPPVACDVGGTIVGGGVLADFDRDMRNDGLPDETQWSILPEDRLDARW